MNTVNTMTHDEAVQALLEAACTLSNPEERRAAERAYDTATMTAEAIEEALERTADPIARRRLLDVADNARALVGEIGELLGVDQAALDAADEARAAAMCANA